jgi:hypothetical protein
VQGAAGANGSLGSGANGSASGQKHLVRVGNGNIVRRQWLLCRQVAQELRISKQQLLELEALGGGGAGGTGNASGPNAGRGGGISGTANTGGGGAASNGDPAGGWWFRYSDSEVFSIMAHFAELDENNKVFRVIVVNNSGILDSDGNGSEEGGKQFCSDLLGGTRVQTACNRSCRKNFAGTGINYDQERNAFISDKPGSSMDGAGEGGGIWEAPQERPMDGHRSISWDEELLSWNEYHML